MEYDYKKFDLGESARLDLMRYLDSHKDDIYHDINDYGDLKDIYFDIYGHYPQPPETE